MNSYTNLVGLLPDPREWDADRGASKIYLFFLDLGRARVDEQVAVSRTNTIYISTAGSDSNSGTSLAAAVLTPSKVVSLATATSGRANIYMICGQTIRSQTPLRFPSNVVDTAVTFTGSPSNGLPIFTCFTNVTELRGFAWSAAPGGFFQATPSAPVSGIILANRNGAAGVDPTLDSRILYRPMVWCQSTNDFSGLTRAACFNGTNVILKGTDPYGADNYQATLLSGTGNSGIQFDADNSNNWVHGIRSLGWGFAPGRATQAYGIAWTGSNCTNLATSCEASFTGRHCIGDLQNAGQSNILTVIGCTTAYGSDSGDGVNSINNYGSGEYVAIGNRPIAAQHPVCYGTQTARITGGPTLDGFLFGHGGVFTLAGAIDNQIISSNIPGATWPQDGFSAAETSLPTDDLADPTTTRGFSINNFVDIASGDTVGSCKAVENTLVINPVTRVRAQSTGASNIGSCQRGRVVNAQLDIVAADGARLFGDAGGGSISTRWVNGQIVVRGSNSAGAILFNNPGAGSAPVLINTLIAAPEMQTLATSSGTGVINSASILKGNLYLGVSTTNAGFSNDANLLSYSNTADVGLLYNYAGGPLDGTGTPLTAQDAFEFDAAGKYRPTSGPSRGPFETIATPALSPSNTNTISEMVRQNVMATLTNVASLTITSRTRREQTTLDGTAILDSAIPTRLDSSPVLHTEWQYNFSLVCYLIESDKSTSPIELRNNTVAADVTYALMVDRHRGYGKNGRDGLAQDTHVDDPIPWYDDRGALSGVIVDFNVKYRTLENDPYTQ